MGIGQPDRLHWPETQRLTPTRGHHLYRHATIKIGSVLLPFLERHRLAGKQRVNKPLILVARHRAVDIVLAITTIRRFVVARLEPGNIHINTIKMNDRGNRVEKRKVFLTAKIADQLSQRRRGEGASGNDHIVPIDGNFCNLTPGDRHQRIGRQQFTDMRGKAIAVNGKRTTCRHLVDIGSMHNQRIHLAHFLMQDADSIAGRIIRAKRI